MATETLQQMIEKYNQFLKQQEQMTKQLYDQILKRADLESKDSKSSKAAQPRKKRTKSTTGSKARSVKNTAKTSLGVHKANKKISGGGDDENADNKPTDISAKKKASSTKKKPPKYLSNAPTHVGIEFTAATAQNKRDDQEDRYCEGFIDLNGTNYFASAVADGHNGAGSADYFCSNFLATLKTTGESKELLKETSPSANEYCAITLKLSAEHLLQNWETKQLSKPMDKRDVSGNTVTAILINIKTGNGAVLNLGDSRTMVFDANDGSILWQTEDHDLSNPDEVKAIEARKVLATGKPCKVTSEDENGTMVPRVANYLAMAKAMGDLMESVHGCVGKEFDVFTIDFSQKPMYILLASDGLYDDVTNDELGSMIAKNKMDASELTKHVVKFGKYGDNVTCVLILVNISK